MKPIVSTAPLVREQVRRVHQRIDEQLAASCRRAEPGSLEQRNALGEYTRVACIEDVTINLLIRNQRPLLGDHPISGEALRWDLARLRDYTRAVHAATDAFLARLAPSELGRTVELADVGLGAPSVAWLLSRFVLEQHAQACDVLAGRVASADGRSRHAPGDHRVAPLTPSLREVGVSIRPRAGAQASGVVGGAPSRVKVGRKR